MRTFTTDADFDAGNSQAVNHVAVHDQLQLDATHASFAFLWIANTSRGTLVRVDANTGQILGEYRTAPDFRSRTPSRTAVDRFGNVWAGNRLESADGRGSIVQVGVVIGGTRGRKNLDGSFVADPAGGYLAPPFDYCTAVDRDGDGLIRTSRGLGDILAWPNVTDGNGGSTALVEDALDECILVYQRTPMPNLHHVAVDAAGGVWVAGYPSASTFARLDGHTGQIVDAIVAPYGGYGGFIDSRGQLWSAGFAQGQLLQLDLASRTSHAFAVNQSSGLALDSHGYLWNTMGTNNQIAKLDPSGGMVAGFPKATFGGSPLGVVVTPDDNVWVANSTTNTVTRLASDGSLRKRITVGTSPNGLCLDASGKIWVTNQTSSNAMRINPQAGADGLGAVDLIVSLGTSAGPLDFGNMSGVVTVDAFATPGTWDVVHDGGRNGVRWSRIGWHSNEPAGTHMTVAVRAADAAESLPALPWFMATNDGDLRAAGLTGRFFEIRVTMTHDAGVVATPALLDLTVQANEPPDCSQARPSVDRLWPPDGRMVDVGIEGVTDPDGDAVTCTITHITQDEPVVKGANGRYDPKAFDGAGIGTPTAQVRAARNGKGDGRVYEVSFVASDGHGGECNGRVQVCVPHDMGQGNDCVDSGQNFDSTAPTDATVLFVHQYPNPFNPSTTIEYVLTEPSDVRLAIYDAMGRLVRVLIASGQDAGPQRALWDGRNAQGATVASGMYVMNLRAGAQTESRRMLLLK